MAHPLTFKRAYDEYRTEAKDRLRNALGALKGDRPETEPFPNIPPHQTRFRVECPYGTDHEQLINPEGALLSHLSVEERLYLACGELIEHVENGDYDDRLDYPGAMPIGQHLHHIQHQLREKAIDAAVGRVEVSRTEFGYRIEDIATGYRANMADNFELSRSEQRALATDRARSLAANQLKAIEEELER